MALISENYRAMNSELHTKNPHFGSGELGNRHYVQIEAIAKSINAITILDYGCGKARFGQAYPHLLVTNYDPAIPEYSDPPDPADLLVSLDVLEHIEPECLDDVLDDMARLAVKGAYLVINTWPANKTLADGRNAHLIQEGTDWWLPKLMQRWEILQYARKANEFFVFAVPKATFEANKKIAFAEAKERAGH